MDLEVLMLNINNLLIKIFFNKLGKRKANIINKFINKSYSNINEYLDKTFTSSISLEEKLYRLKYNLIEKPKCPICNKDRKFLSFKEGYCKTCCKKCSRILASIKTKETKINRYGISTYNNSNKRYITNLIKYNSICPLNNELIKKKAKQTCLKNYGVDNILKNKNIHDKGIKRSQDKDIQIKRNRTIQLKYNVDNISKNEKIKLKKKETFIKHYGYINNFCNEHIQEKCNNLEGQLKRNITKRKNHTFNISIPEKKSYELLKQKYPDIKYQYRSELYPFNCDFYIPLLDLYIECNYYWTHGKHPYDKDNLKDQEKLELWKSKNSKFYSNAIYTWTNLDIRKRNIVKQNNLNYLEFWNINELKEWLSKK